MSRAFVKEDKNDLAELPGRPISPNRNFVTEAGLAAIEAALGRFEAAHRAATDKGDGEAAAAALREVRYWRARRASAEVVKPPADKRTASFGMTVSLRRVDGREQSFRIVGEDEADPSRGTLSYMSPLARAVLTTVMTEEESADLTSRINHWLTENGTRTTMLEYSLRFLAGGIAVSGFAALGDTLRPKSFAGLFGAAPSIALATLLITLSQKGASFVAMESRSMIMGAFALAAYSWTVCVLLKKLLLSSWTATLAALIVWFAVALGVSATLFQLP